MQLWRYVDRSTSYWLRSPAVYGNSIALFSFQGSMMEDQETAKVFPTVDRVEVLDPSAST